MKKLFILSVFPLFIFSCTSTDSGEVKKITLSKSEVNECHASDLISTTQLAGLLNSDKSVKIIDVREVADFNKGHIPMALQLFRSDLEDTGNKIPGIVAPKDKMETLLSKLGISPSDFVVVYDAKGNPDASRLWWILNYYGHKNKAILDGGLIAWKKDKQAISTEKVKLKKSAYHFPELLTQPLYANMEDVKTAISDTNYVILDTRTLEEFNGTAPAGDLKRSGRIPKSVLINYDENVDTKNEYKFKTIEALKEVYKNINPDKKIICYCRTGVRSAMTTFVLKELLGYKNVQNYDGSWSEWSYHEDLPMD